MKDNKNGTGGNALGNRIKTIIEEKGLMQKEFAASLGVSPNYICLITSGRKDSISQTLALLIENIYGYSADWILSGNNNKPSLSQRNLKQDIMDQVRMMDVAELKAVTAFIHSLAEIDI